MLRGSGTKFFAPYLEQDSDTDPTIVLLRPDENTNYFHSVCVLYEALFLLIFVYRYWNSVDSKYVNQELTFSHFAQKLTWRVRLKVYFWNKINLA